MLARANSDAGTHLRRSKSATTVHKRPVSTIESADLEAVRQQAVAAATAAFARAQVQDTTDRATRYSADVLRSKSNASRKSLAAQGSHFPPRESNLRAMQRLKMEHSKSSQRLSQASTVNAEHIKPAVVASLPAPRQLSTQPSVTFNENVRPSSQPKTLRSSAASSVTSQQIRKARSMYYASSVQTGSPIARLPAKYLAASPSVSMSSVSEPSPINPPPRSLRPSPLAAPRIPVTIAPGVTLEQARDDYLQEFQQKSVKHKPSIFLAPFKKRQDKGKEKAKRNVTDTQAFPVSDGQVHNDSTTDLTLSDFMPPQELKEKRSFSGSLKHKIRKAFRRTSVKPTNLPVQHIAATRDYFNTSHVRPSSDNDAASIPCPDEATLQRVRDRTPSHDGAHPICLRSGSRSNSTGSTRSLHSEANAPHVPASRVTSWGTTTTSDTMTQRAIKRMTVIHESKDSIGSEAEHTVSLKAARRKLLPLPPLSSFRDPMPMQSLEEENSTPIDPKRVFSALMREIGTTKSSDEPSPTKRTPGAESDVFEPRTTKLQSQARDLHSSGSHNIRRSIEIELRPPSRRPATALSAQSKTSTIRSLGRAIRSTIRTVTPVGQHSSPDTDVTNFGRKHHGNEEPHSESTPESEGNHADHGAKRKNITQIFAPSAAQTEKQVERSMGRWKTPLEQAEHLQSPHDTDKGCEITTIVQEAHQTVKKSAESNEAEQHAYNIRDQDSSQLPASPKVTRSPASKDMMTPMSPSVYSRNTDGISIDPNDSIMSFDGPSQFEQAHHGGSAVILTSQSVRSYVVGTPSPQREVPARTSRDWRAWLSHEISGMELNSQEDLSINEHYTAFAKRNRSGSVRTSHTENEDTTVVLRGSLNATAIQPDERLENKASQEGEHLGKTKDCGSGDASAAGKIEEEHDSRLNAPDADKFELNLDSETNVNSQVCKPSGLRPASMVSNSRPEGHTLYSHAGPETLKSRSDSTSSIPSLKPSKPTPGPILYPTLSVPSTHKTSLHLPTTAMRRSDAHLHRKENITPQSSRVPKHSTASPQRYSSPLTPQPLLAASPCNSPNTSQPQIPTPTTPLRPRVRAVVRPQGTSPMKLSLRPKSAFDLRGTTNLPNTSKNTDTDARTNLDSPLRRPRSYIRERESNTAPLYTKVPSPEQMSPYTTGTEYEKDKGKIVTTPGQKLAEKFLKERKSALGSEAGSEGGSAERRRGEMRLVREDTPAFL